MRDTTEPDVVAIRDEDLASPSPPPPPPATPASRATGSGTLRPGDRLSGDLEVVRCIGAGGQGEVYEVLDRTSGARFATKLISNDLDPQIVKRLRREADVAAKSRHPNVVDIYGLDRSEGGRLFLKMELLVGRPLDEVLRGGPLPIEVAIEVAVQVANGLSAVHAWGIVHRDLKPANIFMVERAPGSGPPSSARGAPEIAIKLMDFGIAKAHASWQETQLTHTGHVVGTPRYMSPEQVTDPEHVDGRSDIYSLGLILFEMLTGRSPFTASTVPQIFIAHVQHLPPNPVTLRPDIPFELGAIVLKMLSKRPQDRFNTVEQLAARLRSVRQKRLASEAPRVPTTPVSSSDPSLGRVLLPAAVVVVLLGVLWLRTSGTRPAPEATTIVVAGDREGAEPSTVPEGDGPGAGATSVVEPPAFEPSDVPVPEARGREPSPDPGPDPGPREARGTPSVAELHASRSRELRVQLRRRGLSLRDVELIDPELGSLWLSWPRGLSGGDAERIQAVSERLELAIESASLDAELLGAKLDRALGALSAVPKPMRDELFLRHESEYISLRSAVSSERLPRSATSIAADITRLEDAVHKRYHLRRP